MSVKVGTRETTHHHRTSSSVATYGAAGNSITLSSVEVHRHLSEGSMPPAVYHVKMRKAKRVRFLCNGDKFYKGIVIPVTSERYRSFDSLLNDLTRLFSGNINLPSGVRTLFGIDGVKISHLDDLEDGKYYVCAGKGEQFKRLDYTALSCTNTSVLNSRGVRPSSSLSKLSYSNSVNSSNSTNISNNNNVALSHIGNSASNNITLAMTNSGGSQSSSISSSKSSNCVIRPRIIIVVRNGTRPRRVSRLLLNKRNSPSFDHALSTITDAVKLDTGAVRKVFNSKGTQIYHLEEFFGEEDVFFVYGSERVSQDDFGLEFEELRAIQTHKKELRRPVTTELKNGTHCMDESGKTIPKLPFTSKRMKTMKQLEYALTIPNNVLARYTVGQIVGDGNFAVVRKCADRLKNVDYALKIIDKSKVAGKEQMILNELSILKHTNHPNIIQFIAEHDTPTELYLIMEFVSGGDLFDAISKKVKFTEEDAQIVTHDLASALSYLHCNNIVHRDIKPENLLLEMENDHRIKQLKVADFGLAQVVTEPLYAVCGTPTYVAPEILMEIGYGLQIDVWAAGVILYILLCGFPPFVSSSNSQEELFVDILSGEYGFPSPYWDDVSSPAKDLISNMIQSNPSLRFSADDILEHPWISL